MARGGSRPGAGRRRGSVNKLTHDVRALAQKHSIKAMDQLAKLAEGAESEAARVAAIKEILDRAYGKSKQPTEVTGENGGPVGIAVRFVSKPEREGS